MHICPHVRIYIPARSKNVLFMLQKKAVAWGQDNFIFIVMNNEVISEKL